MRYLILFFFIVFYSVGDSQGLRTPASGNPGKVSDDVNTAKPAESSDPRIKFYLKLPKPTVDQIKPFLGKWTGMLIVPGGQNVSLEKEFLIEGTVVKVKDVFPWDDNPIASVPPVFHVTSKNELIFGQRNGSGLMITICKLESDGTLSGKDERIGIELPPDADDELKKHFKFSEENPCTFKLKKAKSN